MKQIFIKLYKISLFEFQRSMKNLIVSLLCFCFGLLYAERPNIVLVMTDDQGWGQAGYMNHPLLKTPHLDAMAANGLRFEQFYAGAPVCSPTRASVLTARNNDRTGVFSHGYALRLEEKTLSQALKKAGYATGHFGKWHLDGLRGAGVPVLKDDAHSPGAFGFDEWLTVTNFFDVNPLMGRKGKFEEFKGDSSEIIVDEALKFIEKQKENKKPFFTVIWYGSPHNPFYASEEDTKDFSSLPENAAKHHGELVAMDRSLGTLRKGLKQLGLAANTLVWFNSDNGGLKTKEVGIDSVGGLRGNKGTLYEGGLRVPCVIEWPKGIKPRITKYPASTMDIMPTILDLLGLPKTYMNAVVDGESLKPLFETELEKRVKPIPFHAHNSSAAMIVGDYKIIQLKLNKEEFEIYHLKNDPAESKNLFDSHPKIAEKLKQKLLKFNASVQNSIEGKDYSNGIVYEQAPRQFWHEAEAYDEFLEEFVKRPEYKRYEKVISKKLESLKK